MTAKRTPLGITLILGLIGASSLLAQQVPADKAKLASDKEKNKEEAIVLSPFVVSNEGDQGYRTQQTMIGSRTAKNLLELPVAVSIIGLPQIEDAAAVDIHEVLKYGTSGVTRSQSFNNDVNIRGFRALGGTLRNGNIARTSNKHLPFFDIERVEVLKGPAAMLSGSNSGMGGTLNYFSRRPTDKPMGELKTSVNSAGRLRGQINASGPLYKSGDSFRVNYRGTLGVAKSDTYLGKDPEWEDQRYYGGALTMYFGNNTSLTVEGSYDDNRTYIYLWDFLDISVPVDPRTGLTDAKLNRYSTLSYAPGRRKDAFWPLKYTDITATYLQTLTDNSNLRFVYNFTRLYDSRRNNRGITVRPDNYTLARQDIRNDNGNVVHGFQMDYQHRLERKWGKLDTMAGADGFTQNGFTNESILFMPDADSRTGVAPNDDAFYSQYMTDFDLFDKARPATAGTPATKNKTNNRSLSYYVQENVSFLQDRVIVVGGLRWFKPYRSTLNRVTNVLTEDFVKKHRVHRYGIVVKLLPTVSAYYTDAQNLFPANPGRTDLVIQNDGLGEPFKDSEGKLQELGIKFDYKFSERITGYGSAAVFKMEQTNIRTFGTLPSGNQGLIQSAMDSAEGWETDLGLRIKTDTGAWDVIVTYFNGDSAIALDKGKAYVRQANAFAPWKYSLFGRYAWSSGSLRGVRFGFGVEDEDKRRNGAHLVDRPLTADGFIGYQINKQWDAQLNLTNLTNETYIIQVAATGLVSREDQFRAKFTLTYNW